MWYMTEERKLLQKMVRDFTQKEIKPFVDQMEKDAYPREILKKLGEIGVLGLCLDDKYGGSGEDWINMGIALEEIAKESNTVALLTALASDMTAHMIAPLCTPEQVEKFVKPAVKGDILLGHWTTEPCGIFNIAEYETTAVLDGDEWVLNGGKIFCTNAGQCDYAFVVCKTNENANAATFDGWSWIMVPTKNTPGFEVGHIEHKLGWRGSSTGQVYFNNCRVPKKNLIGEKDKVFPYLLANLVPGYCLYGAWTLGSAESVYEKTRKFLSERIQGGKSLWDTHQVVRCEMAKMWCEIETFRASLYAILESRNQGMDIHNFALALKLKGSELLEHVASSCIELHGGVGTVYETGIERYYRDAKMNYIGCGSNKTLVDYLTNFI